MTANDSNSAVGARLIDLAVPMEPMIPRDFVLGTLIAAFLLFVLALIASTFVLPVGTVLRVTGVVLAAAAAVAVFALLIVRALRHDTRIRAARRQLQSADAAMPPPIGPLQVFVQSERQQPRLGLIARTLARRGFRDLALRYVRPGLPPTTVAPFTIPFEPCPLNEADAAFRGIATGAADIGGVKEHSETALRIRRAWRMSSLGFLAMAAVQIVIHGWRALLSRTLIPELLMWTAVLAVVFLAFLVPRSATGPILLVPGGVIHRRARWLSAKSRVHLYTPAAGILIVYPLPGTRRAWAVANGVRSLTGVGTELEIEALLRAWLSPLPPPTPEMLSGLGGD